jgi:hypothetical protein
LPPADVELENEFDFPVPPTPNKPQDREELWQYVRECSENVKLTEPMIIAYAKEIEMCYRDKVDGVWRNTRGEPLVSWRKNIGIQWLTDLKIQEFKNKYLKLHPQQQVASMPKTRNN